MTTGTEPGIRTGSERILAINYVKALAIVAVAFTHAGLPLWDPNRNVKLHPVSSRP